MALDASLYRLFGAQPRSVADYDLQAASVESAKQANALNALKLQQGQQAMQESNALTALYQQYGATPDALPGQLRSRGFVTQAAELDKQAASLQQTQAQTASLQSRTAGDEFDTRKKRFDLALRGLVTADTPQQALDYVDAAVKRGDLDEATAQQMRGKVPADPAQFPAWRRQSLLSALDAKERAEIEFPKQAKPTDLARLITERDALPPGDPRRATYDAAITKETTRAPAASITVGLQAPVPVVDPNTGQTVFVQPANKPGASAQVLTAPGGRPFTQPPKGEGKDPTEAEKLAGGYALRMQQATKLLDQFEATGKPTVYTAGAAAIPSIGETARRFAMTPDQGRYRQAQEDWVRAKLRKESGAAIGNEEMDKEIATYFPQVGDKPEVIEQKGESRKVANQAMVNAAGRGAPKQSEQTISTVAPKRIASDAEYNALPSGATFIGPDGKTRRKP